MLKELHRVWERSQRQAAAWRRWARKLPHNRVSRPRLRDAQGRRIGYGAAVPIPEPIRPRSFCREQTLPSGRVVLVLDDQGAQAAYRLARYPRPTREAVEPLPLPEEEIRRLFAALCGVA